ncbi:transposase, partial [Rhodovulum sulfidophilum]|uniref:integrase core domain-containing protein n=1 Tax=Rhodovulum sulfidophilum TaxID=35806 RepID=UPI0019288CBE
MAPISSDFLEEVQSAAFAGEDVFAGLCQDKGLGRDVVLKQERPFSAHCVFHHWASERRLSPVSAHAMPRPHAREEIGRWRSHYNTKRPHSALGYLSPTEFLTKTTAPALETL